MLLQTSSSVFIQEHFASVYPKHHDDVCYMLAIDIIRTLKIGKHRLEKSKYKGYNHRFADCPGLGGLFEDQILSGPRNPPCVLCLYVIL